MPLLHLRIHLTQQGCRFLHATLNKRRIFLVIPIYIYSFWFCSKKTKVNFTASIIVSRAWKQLIKPI
jgi:hypothetical protein